MRSRKRGMEEAWRASEEGDFAFLGPPGQGKPAGWTSSHFQQYFVAQESWSGRSLDNSVLSFSERHHAFSFYSQDVQKLDTVNSLLLWLLTPLSVLLHAAFVTFSFPLQLTSVSDLSPPFPHPPFLFRFKGLFTLCYKMTRMYECHNISNHCKWEIKGWKNKTCCIQMSFFD